MPESLKDGSWKSGSRKKRSGSLGRLLGLQGSKKSEVLSPALGNDWASGLSTVSERRRNTKGRDQDQERDDPRENCFIKHGWGH